MSRYREGERVDFLAILDQVIDQLQQRGRLTYRTLKRQYELDDEALEDLKEELIYGQRLAVDEEQRILAWSGEAPSSSQNPQSETDREIVFPSLCLGQI